MLFREMPQIRRSFFCRVNLKERSTAKAPLHTYKSSRDRLTASDTRLIRYVSQEKFPEDAIIWI